MDRNTATRAGWMLRAIIHNANFDINNRPRLSHVRIDIQSEEQVRSSKDTTSAITLSTVTSVITSLLPDDG
jgi:hypothetical protein